MGRSTVPRAQYFVRSAPLSCATRKLSARRSSRLPPEPLAPMTPIRALVCCAAGAAGCELRCPARGFKLPGTLEWVFQAMLENATRICGAKFGILFRYEGGAFDQARKQIREDTVRAGRTRCPRAAAKDSKAGTVALDRAGIEAASPQHAGNRAR